MASNTYMLNRKKYTRPQAILWSENSGTLTNGLYVPNGFEINADHGSSTTSTDFDQFMILSDDNRSPLSFSTERIEKRERMINGRMRSYHIADKLKIDLSWNMLPSRSSNSKPLFDSNGNPVSSFENSNGDTVDFVSHTTDGGAGGAEILEWYENHTGSFWMFLAYDKYTNLKNTQDINQPYEKLNVFNQLVEVFFTDISYSVEKRGANNFDFWNISVSLEEV